MCGGVVGVAADRHFQRVLGLVEFILRCVQHRQIVVGFGQFGKIFSQAGENLDRLGGFILLGEDQPFQKTRLRVLRIFGQISIGPLQCAAQVALAKLLIDILYLGGEYRCRCQDQAQYSKKAG